MTNETLVTCSSCKGSGKRKLSKKLKWCLTLLAEHGPCSPSQLHKLSAKKSHVSYFNHMLKRLEKFGLVESSEGIFKVKE
jgi:DNA-binding MarR family transcriptional regulator